MKLSIHLFSFLAILLFSQASYAVHTVTSAPFGQESISVDDFLHLKYANVKASSAKKLKLKDRLAFLATKRYLKQQLKAEKLLEVMISLRLQVDLGLGLGPL